MRCTRGHNLFTDWATMGHRCNSIFIPRTPRGLIGYQQWVQKKGVCTEGHKAFSPAMTRHNCSHPFTASIVSTLKELKMQPTRGVAVEMRQANLCSSD
eukprot:1141422-Pelagomonas_calceolata.AAC.3